MILIISDNIGLTVAKYRKRIHGLGRCRLRGTMNKKACRIVPRHQLSLALSGSDTTKIIWDGFQPTADEERQADARLSR